MTASRTLHSLAAPAVAIAVFAVTLDGEFVYDDAVLVEKDIGLREFDLQRILADNYWGPARVDTNYRPLTLLSYALNHRFGDGPLGFHLVNVVLHAASSWLAFIVLRRLLDDGFLAALGATLYAALAIHTEAVAGIVGRAEILAAVFALSAWSVSLRNDSDRSALGVVGVGLLVFLGMCSKESAAVILPVIWVAAMVRGTKVPWRSLVAGAVAFGLYLAVRRVVLDEQIRLVASGSVVPVGPTDNPLAYAEPLTRMVNAVHLLGLYAWKTVLPLETAADYSFDQLPVRPLSSFLPWGGALAFLGSISAGGWLLRRRAPTAALGLLFFPLAFAVSGNVLFPIGTIFAERLDYLPSFALPIFLAGLAGAALESKRLSRRGVLLIWCIVVAANAVQCVRWSRVWRDDTTLFPHSAIASPRSARALRLGASTFLKETGGGENAAGVERRYGEAEALLDRALDIDPDDGGTVARKGLLFVRRAVRARQLGMPQDSTAHYQRAEALFTRGLELLARRRRLEAEIWMHRASVRFDLGRYREAFDDFERYIAHVERRGGRPAARAYDGRATSRAILARTLSPEKREAELESSLGDYDKAISIRSDAPDYFNNRGFCRRQLGDLAGAAADYRRGLDLCLKSKAYVRPAPGQSQSAVGFHAKLANLYREMGRPEDAQREGAAAAELKARFAGGAGSN